MDAAQVNRFVEDWLQAWNDHDLDGVLRHFAEGAVFTSPLATQLMAQSDGVICGKAALRDYWAEGLRRIPELRFEVLGIYVGVHTIVINYRNQRGGVVNEVLTFDGRSWSRGTAPTSVSPPTQPYQRPADQRPAGHRPGC